jgi:selenide, water dikinase
MMKEINEQIELTQFSHGAGCGCKISPRILDQILSGVSAHSFQFSNLLVGNADRDDAAVLDLGDGTAIISTTDFFMPIVDDAETFGKIAAANAISDIYAMGGTPLMAIAILGWPVNMISAEIAGKVIDGAQKTCHEAGIPLAGGHSIDSPEPIFGLAVTGRVNISHLKKNGGANAGDILFLTKPLGIGILSTAQKKGIVMNGHDELAAKVMMRLNSVGEDLGKLKGVSAMTDITGFGLAGHLIEMCRASDTSAIIHYHQLPLITPSLTDYIKAGSIPGGTNRNFDSYGHEIVFTAEDQRFIMCDPQTSGGLLIAVSPEYKDEVQTILKKENLWSEPVGEMTALNKHLINISAS